MSLQQTEPRQGTSGGGGFGVCPFSLAVFFGTAAYVAYQQRQRSSSTSTSTSRDAASASDDELPVCQVVFVLGGPGAGKGTQCELLSKRMTQPYCWAHLSAGDLLRAEREKGGPVCDLINARIAAGELVPAEIVCRLLENGMKELYASNKITKFLVDGFPRSQGNVDAWVQTMQKHTVEFVLFFECPEEVLVGRLLERGQTSGRSDDTIQVIRKRFATFKEESVPIVQVYQAQGKVRQIASDKPVESVYAEVAALFEGL